VTFTVQPEQLSLIIDDGRRAIEAGAFQVAIGGCQPGYEALVDGSTEMLSGKIEVSEGMTLNVIVPNLLYGSRRCG
jgi:beta-glucosidase